MKNIAIIVTLVIGIASTNGQSFNFNSGDSIKHFIILETGAEYGLMFKAGYAHKTKLLDHPLIWVSDLSMPYLKFDFNDYKVKAGIQIPILLRNNWITSLNSAIIARGLETENNTSFNLGYEIGIKTGLYKSNKFIAAEAGFDHALLTHITNSDFYKENYYSEAKDGWYSITGGNVYYGLSGGIDLKRSLISLRLGKILDRYFDSPSDFSVYFVLGYHFKL